MCVPGMTVIALYWFTQSHSLLLTENSKHAIMKHK
jgi:hypothetical protein